MRLAPALLLLLCPVVAADEVRVRVDRPSEVHVVTDGAGKITVLVVPTGPAPNPVPTPPEPTPTPTPTPTPDPQPEPPPKPDPAPALTGLAKVAYDQAKLVSQADEASQVAVLYRTAAAKIAAGVITPQDGARELGASTKAILADRFAAWTPAIQAVADSAKQIPTPDAASYAAILRDIATGLEAVK